MLTFLQLSKLLWYAHSLACCRGVHAGARFDVIAAMIAAGWMHTIGMLQGCAYWCQACYIGSSNSCA